MATQATLIIENFIVILVMKQIMIILNHISLNNGVRVHTGIKYYRITWKGLNLKIIIMLQWAKDSAEKQAGHFFDSRIKQISEFI